MPQKLHAALLLPEKAVKHATLRRVFITAVRRPHHLPRTEELDFQPIHRLLYLRLWEGETYKIHLQDLVGDRIVGSLERHVTGQTCSMADDQPLQIHWMIPYQEPLHYLCNFDMTCFPPSPQGGPAVTMQIVAGTPRVKKLPMATA